MTGDRLRPHIADAKSTPKSVSSPFPLSLTSMQQPATSTIDIAYPGPLDGVYQTYTAKSEILFARGIFPPMDKYRDID